MVQRVINNPHANAPLIVPTLVVRNTPKLTLDDNIRTNAARDLPWLNVRDAHSIPAVIVGGGPSLADHVDDIRAAQQAGATVYALNAASLWLNRRGIVPDYQVVVDAQASCLAFVDTGARGHLFASQVHPSVMDAVPNPIVWHLGGEGVEDLFPAERVRRGGYSLVGGGAAVGTCAACLAFILGHRTLDFYGVDSSNRDGATHAYGQAMNAFIPNVEVEWAGKTFSSSVAMKAQAEWFMILGRQIESAGASVRLHGDGLLPTMWNTPPEHLTERDKYRIMWQSDQYRAYSPGEVIVDSFIDLVRPDDLVIDFGCGTGRAALRMAERGIPVFCIDFADNCRDDAAIPLPFLEWDLTKPCHLRAPYGYCTDVLEHIPPDQVETVVSNIMASARTVFFQISTVPDAFGALINQRLHLTVEPHEWWAQTFARLGFAVTWQSDLGAQSQFVVKRGSHA